jgi:hypothetical protein
VWAGRAAAVAKVDEPSGWIRVFVYSARGLAAVGGSLVDVTFTVRSTPAVSDVTHIDLMDVRLNEGRIALNADPRPGLDPTDGALTVMGGSRNNVGNQVQPVSEGPTVSPSNPPLQDSASPATPTQGFVGPLLIQPVDPGARTHALEGPLRDPRPVDLVLEQLELRHLANRHDCTTDPETNVAALDRAGFVDLALETISPWRLRREQVEHRIWRWFTQNR